MSVVNKTLYKITLYANGWVRDNLATLKAMGVPDNLELDYHYDQPERTEINREYQYTLIIGARSKEEAIARAILTNPVFGSWVTEKYGVEPAMSYFCDPYQALGRKLLTKYYANVIVSAFINDGITHPGEDEDLIPLLDDEFLTFVPLTWAAVRKSFTEAELHRLDHFARRHSKYALLLSKINCASFDFRGGFVEHGSNQIDEKKGHYSLSLPDTLILAKNILKVAEELEVSKV